MDQQLLELLDWAAKHGARDSMAPEWDSQCSGTGTEHTQRSCLGSTLAMAAFPEAGGRGLAASRALTAGEVLLAIPEVLLMTARSACADPVLGPLIAGCPSLSPHQVLILHLLHEVSKGAASFWRPYLLALPRAHHTLALFPPSQVPHLQVPHAMEAARHARTQAHREWSAAEQVLQALALPHNFRCFQAWLWANATVTSRTVAVPYSLSGALCPVGDLFNYAAPSPADQSVRLTDGAFDDDCNAFCFYARQDYAVGQQVLLCYGTYRNLELLEHYGFLLPANPNDAVTIPLPNTLHPTQPGSGDAHRGDPPGAEGESRLDCYVGADGQPSFALLAALRLRAASTMERKQRGHVASAGMQISVAGDVRVYEWLRSTCQQLLSALATSLESDLALQKRLRQSGHTRVIKPGPSCATPDHPTNSKANVPETLNLFFLLALDWRIGYKEILALAIQHSANRLKELNG